MAATIGVYFHHGFIGKKSQAQPYTARAHSRYIQRTNATQSVHTHLMPDSYAARQRWFFDHENNLRANGRVIDKFIISVPRSVSEQDAIAAAMTFGKHIGQEKCPFMFTLQGFDTDNHHVHFIFVDKSIEDGKRVYGTTERNSTRGLKLEWEATANAMFEELGYDVRVKVHDGQVEANDNTPQEVEQAPPALEQPPEIDTVQEPVEEDAGDGDAEMAYIDVERQENVDLVTHEIRLLHSTATEWGYLREAQQQLENAKAREAQLTAKLQDTQFEASIYDAQSLPILMQADERRQRLEAFQKEDGSLKGFAFATPELKFLGLRLKPVRFATQTRIEAEQAQDSYERIKDKAAYIEKRKTDLAEAVTGLTQQTEEMRKTVEMKSNELRALYGNEHTMQMTSKSFENTVQRCVENLSLDHAREVLEEGLITKDEYITFLEYGGHKEELDNFLEEIGEDYSESP